MSFLKKMHYFLSYLALHDCFSYLQDCQPHLKKRIAEHIYNIKIGYKYHSVLLHFRQCHGRDPAGLNFWEVDKNTPQRRGNNMVRGLSKRETKWIYMTDMLTPKGLNIEINIHCFISDY